MPSRVREKVTRSNARSRRKRKPGPALDLSNESRKNVNSEPPGKGWRQRDWAQYYVRYWKFAVTPLRPATKKPYQARWQKHPITDATEAQRHWTENPEDGIGVVLGPSGLVSLDIDSPKWARAAFKAVGIDLEALSDKADVPRIEGAPGRYRLLFRAPSGTALLYQPLVVPQESGKETTVLELRAGLVQDVLPPSIHPDTGSPYHWTRAPWETGGIPALPKDIFSLWHRWDDVVGKLREAAVVTTKETKKTVANGTRKSLNRPAKRPLPARLRPVRGGNRAEAQDVTRFYVDPRFTESQPIFAKTLASLLAGLEAVTGSSRQWYARCPAHPDFQPSLSVGLSEDNTKILVFCHSGCQIDEIMAAIGMDARDLFVEALDGLLPRERLARDSLTKRPVSRDAGRRTNGADRHGDENSHPEIDWRARAQKYQNALTTKRLAKLAAALGLPNTVLKMIGVGWRKPVDAPGVYTFPERDGDGTIIGIATRTLDGKKRAIKGSRRGVILPRTWSTDIQDAPRIFIVEGPSDVAAALALSMFAVGRPSATGGVEHLVWLLDLVSEQQEIIVLGENDAKSDGSWPGRDGAEGVAKKLSAELRRNVAWALPPDGAKDLRAWFLTKKEVT